MKPKKEWTLANAFEHVAAVMENGHLTDANYKQAAGATAYINSVLDISPHQCYLLAVMLKRLNETTATDALAQFADVDLLRILDMQRELDDLVARELILCIDDSHYHKWEQTFMLTDGLIHAVRYNRPFSPISMADWSAYDVIDTMQMLLHECDYSRISFKAAETQLRALIEQTQHVKMCRVLKDYQLRSDELVLLLIACVVLVVKKRDMVRSGDYDDILPEVAQTILKRKFRHKIGTLPKSGLMRQDAEDEDEFVVTNMGRTMLLSEFEVPLLDESEPKVEEVEEEPEPEQEEEENDTASETEDEKQEKPVIAEKKLFYNSREKEQIERLANIIEEENFAKVQMRMRAAGMRPGFTAIMHGEPGTGKTETVLQLARRTGREIIQVNLSTLRDKYVGESEKNVQKVFDDYREKMQEGGIVPILLFNEADGIFGRRSNNVQSEVEQMENTIQNIILQNMESFEGIMIATTNLTMNMDAAFERRFLYKIEFHRPSREVRAQIWLSLLPGLKPEDAKTLATRYELSGGQIENITRKQMIESILYDAPLSLSKLCTFCEEECLHKKPKNIFDNRKVS